MKYIILENDKIVDRAENIGEAIKKTEKGKQIIAEVIKW